MLHTDTHACERAHTRARTHLSHSRDCHISPYFAATSSLIPSPHASPTPLPHPSPQPRLPPLQKNNFQVATAGPTSKVNTLHPAPFVYFTTTTISSTPVGTSPSIPPSPPVHTFNLLLGGEKGVEKEISRTKPNQNSVCAHEF